MTSFDYNEEQLTKIINSYKNKKEKEKERYERIKDTVEYKEDKKQNYQDNKQFFQARNSYYYYRKKNNLKKFVERFPERVELLENHGFIIPI